MILDQGLEELAEQFAVLITQGQWGSGSTLPTPSDTGLETPIAATLISVTATSSGNSSQFNYNIPSTVANGSTFVEFGIIFSDATEFNRRVGASFSKTDSFDVETITTVNFIRSS